MDEWICLHCLVVELCDICHSSTYTLFTHTYIYYIYICIYLCNLILYSSFSDSFNGFFCNFFLIYLNILCVVMVSIQWWWWLYWCLCKWKYLVRHDCSFNYSGHLVYIYIYILLKLLWARHLVSSFLRRKRMWMLIYFIRSFEYQYYTVQCQQHYL